MIVGAGRREWTGKHTLAALLLFFGTIFAFNGVMVWFAMDSWPGLVERLGWKEGQRFNDQLARKDAQRALGWQASARIVKAGDRREVIRLSLRDRHGRALTGVEVSAQLRRPVTEIMDRRLNFTESSPGEYQTGLVFPARGNWHLALVVKGANGRDFEKVLSLWLD